MTETRQAPWLWAYGVFAASGLLGSRLYLLAAAAIAAYAWSADHHDR
jgi:hypothetical protein